MRIILRIKLFYIIFILKKSFLPKTHGNDESKEVDQCIIALHTSINKIIWSVSHGDVDNPTMEFGLNWSLRHCPDKLN